MTGALGIAATATLSPWWPTLVSTADAAPLAYTMKPERLADGVYMLSGAQEAITRDNGGAIANIAILDSREGAIIIDTGPSRRYGEALEKLARELTGKSVARVYLTHFHPDHVFGNQAFPAETIAAPQGVITGLQQMGEDFATAMYHSVGDWMRGTELVLPQKAVTTGVEEIGGRRLRLVELSGHTSSDLVVLDEQTGLLFAGDLVFLDRSPTTPQADLAVWHRSLAALADIPHDRLMPGHGPVEAGRRGIEQTRDWLMMIEETIRGAFERGLTMTEAFAEPLPEWTASVALARYEFERSVMHLYPRLEAGSWPRVDKSD